MEGRNDNEIPGDEERGGNKMRGEKARGYAKQIEKRRKNATMVVS